MKASSKAAVISREFNSLAVQYESNRLAPWYKAHSEEILKMCEALTVKSVLDVGCGTAYLLRRLCKLNPDLKAFGIDLSTEMISVAEKKAEAEDIRNLQLINADWEALTENSFAELKEAGIELIVCSNAFHYFSDPQLAAKKFYDLLDIGGSLIILDRDKSSSPLTLLWGLLHRHFIKDQVEFYTLSELTHFFQDVGFQSVSHSQSIRRYFWKGKLFTSIALLNSQK